MFLLKFVFVYSGNGVQEKGVLRFWSVREDVL